MTAKKLAVIFFVKTFCSVLKNTLINPYKVVSVVDSITGEQAITPTTTNGIYFTEKRPDSRTFI